jgi:DNA-binding transcriptional LysR family regulator
VTQSTVSTALRRLRAALGEQLVERQGNAMVPTRSALAIWPEIRASLHSIEANLNGLRAFDPARQATRLRLGLDEYSFTVFGSRLFQSIRRAAPHTRVEFLPVGPPDAADALAEGSLDLAVGATWTPLPGLRVEPLFAEEFLALIDAKHPTIQSEPTLEQYLAVPHLLVSSVGEVVGNVDSALVKIGRQRQIGVTVPHLLAAPQLLVGSDMIFHAGRRLADRFTAWYPIRAVGPPIAIPGFVVAMVWHQRNTSSRAHEWLRTEVRASHKTPTENGGADLALPT